MEPEIMMVSKFGISGFPGIHFQVNHGSIFRFVDLLIQHSSGECYLLPRFFGWKEMPPAKNYDQIS